MAVEIKIKGSSDTPEYQDALELKKIFESQIQSNVNGEILIINSATLFGQDVKDIDLIVIGKFERLNSLKLQIKTKHTFYDSITTKNQYENYENFKILNESLDGKRIRILSDKFVFNEVLFYNFCFVIETKKHDPSNILIDGITLKVRYQNTYDGKLFDVTTQSEKQKYSLKRFFEDRLGFSPHISNFIWLKNVETNSLNALFGGNDTIKTQHNYLPRIFSLNWIFQLACVQIFPYRYGAYLAFSSHNNFDGDLSEIQEIFQIFENIKRFSGEITRKKLKMITNSILDDDRIWAQAIGEKLVIISGKAGTGKTIKILRIAFDLFTQKDARSLILTYNQALVGDIRRLLAIEGVPDGLDTRTIHISTLHKFFYDLILGFGIVNGKFIPSFIKNYKSYLAELYDYINKGLINVNDIQELMKKSHDQVAWDYVLIDEAQDWDELEKNLIFLIFGISKLILGDGIDQLIRSQKKCDWLKGLKAGTDYHRKIEKKCLRQKRNLVDFVNLYADKFNLRWELVPTQELSGGRIIISSKPYNLNLHEKEYNQCKQNGNIAYDYMFVIPPSLVKRKKIINKYHEEEEVRSFKLSNEFKEMNINIWDGTNTEIRCDYPIDPNQHRLLQYESCRGLEAWTVVCLDLDEFVRYKSETFEDYDNGTLALQSIEEKKNEFIFLWSLIPLTRAIDTIIITISDKNSLLYQKLKEIAKELPDIVDWIE